MIDNNNPVPEEIFDNEDVIKNLRELTIGSKTAGIYADKYGMRWGNADFDKAGAWIKTDGTYSFTRTDGQQILSSNGIEAQAINGGTSIFGWTSTVYFQSMDENTIDWEAGKIKLADGTEFEITAGSTGEFIGQVYIYLDTDLSRTKLQSTTDGLEPVGLNKILVAIGNEAQSGSLASLQVFGGAGGILVGYDNIAKNSIRGFDHIMANTIGAGELTTGTFVTSSANIGSEVVEDSHIKNLRVEKLIGTNIIGKNIVGGEFKSTNGLGRIWTDSGGDIKIQGADDVEFYAGGQARCQVGSGSLRPLDDGYDLGTNDDKWDRIYSEYLRVDTIRLEDGWSIIVDSGDLKFRKDGETMAKVEEDGDLKIKGELTEND